LSFSQLAGLYARRAREFSETVALIGRHRDVGPEVLLLIEDIKRRRGLCFEAAEKFEEYVKQNRTMSVTAMGQ
jgi:hypothetical protein